MGTSQKKKENAFQHIVGIFRFFISGCRFHWLFFHEEMNSPSSLMHITWGWLYAAVQIPLTWLLAGIYYYKMKQFDRRMKELRQGDAA
ncbi:DUF485 domain-containing protein [Virgibacillus halophilus]|uniref:DUF485 domain-containing protein n=1 Tax=Tigheibacillus halophilus TaxID=361280 RepID=A0ABU5C9C8_9BACI|nr:DUF485 domain-containing protein [Virgibacillus halophilus]